MERIPPGTQILTAREFTANTVALNPSRALTAVQEIAARSGRFGPPLNVSDILEALRDRYGLVEAVEMLAEAVGG